MDHTTVIHVDGMTCAHCVKAVTSVVSEVEGVRNVRVELRPGAPSTVTVRSTTTLDADALRAAVDEAGYTVAAIHGDRA